MGKGGTWRCGHPKTPENTQSVGAAGVRCKTCRRIITKRSRERLSAHKVTPDVQFYPLRDYPNYGVVGNRSDKPRVARFIPHSGVAKS